MNQAHWKTTLEAVGVPISLATKSAEIIQKEVDNPQYKRTPTEQEIITHAHTWWVAQGGKTCQKD